MITLGIFMVIGVIMFAVEKSYKKIRKTDAEYNRLYQLVEDDIAKLNRMTERGYKNDA